MNLKERFAAIVGWFEENRPVAETELHYENTFQLLVAVILSAQCTDRRVNIVTPPLFERFPTPSDLASATFDEVFPYVKSVSYPNSKTTHLIAMAQKLLADFDGEVPSDIDALMSLPGVGRKTANVIASVVYDQPVIAVDTHVFRVSHRLGLTGSVFPTARRPWKWSATWSGTSRPSGAPSRTTGSSYTDDTPAQPAIPNARTAGWPNGAGTTFRGSSVSRSNKGKMQ